MLWVNKLNKWEAGRHGRSGKVGVGAEGAVPETTWLSYLCTPILAINMSFLNEIAKKKSWKSWKIASVYFRVPDNGVNCFKKQEVSFIVEISNFISGTERNVLCICLGTFLFSVHFEMLSSLVWMFPVFSFANLHNLSLWNAQWILLNGTGMRHPACWLHVHCCLDCRHFHAWMNSYIYHQLYGLHSYHLPVCIKVCI